MCYLQLQIAALTQGQRVMYQRCSQPLRPTTPCNNASVPVVFQRYFMDCYRTRPQVPYLYIWGTVLVLLSMVGHPVLGRNTCRFGKWRVTNRGLSALALWKAQASHPACNLNSVKSTTLINFMTVTTGNTFMLGTDLQFYV